MNQQGAEEVSREELFRAALRWLESVGPAYPHGVWLAGASAQPALWCVVPGAGPQADFFKTPEGELLAAILEKGCGRKRTEVTVVLGTQTVQVPAGAAVLCFGEQARDQVLPAAGTGASARILIAPELAAIARDVAVKREFWEHLKRWLGSLG